MGVGTGFFQGGRGERNILCPLCFRPKFEKNNLRTLSSVSTRKKARVSLIGLDLIILLEDYTSRVNVCVAVKTWVMLG